MTVLLQRISEGEDLQATSGFGAVQSEHGNLPLSQLSYHAQVIALAVRTTILQTYYNPFDQTIEAEYIFPLEYGHAVTACEMRVADRVIHARLKERGEARREYDEAIENGYRAALLEENRPETFSMKVGNIPPGEAIQVCIQTVSQLPVVRGQWTLRLPLVVAPRYTSGIPLPRAASGSGIAADTNQVPDASSVTPPTLLPGFMSPVDLQLVVDIDLGQLPCGPDWMRMLKSSLHTALIDKMPEHGVGEGDAARCRVQLLPGERVDRDFILRGTVSDQQATSSLVCEKEQTLSATKDATNVKQNTTFALTIVPPRKAAGAPRKVFYLLDRSGSMTGWKLTAAKRGLCRLMDRLTDQDRFQLALFDDRIDTFKSSWFKRDPWVPATDANRFEATSWLSRCDTRGGTELGEALAAALREFVRTADAHKAGNNALVLVTDGQVTGEDSLLRLIDSIPAQHVPRLFCLGVDRAVNGSVLHRLARRTGGTFELVESEHRLDEVLASFADEIGNPAITELSISSEADVPLNIAPHNVTTLYSGRSQTIYGRVAVQDELSLVVRGKLPDGKPYEQKVCAVAGSPAEQPFLRSLWGKERVRTLEDDLFAGGVYDEALQQKIVDCSLECQVLSRLTAFVAVDETEKVTQGQRPHSIIIPVELPEGWSKQMVRLDPASLIKVPVMHRGSGVVHTSMESWQAIGNQAVDELLRSGKISAEQLTDAQTHAAARGLDVCRSLIEMQYTNYEQLGQAIAAVTKTPFVQVSQLNLAEETLLLIPESVARENHVLPIADGPAALSVVMSNPHDLETIEKLRFILNRNIQAFCGAHDEIERSINDHYGQFEGESADSILQEFTDTQISFSDVYDDSFESEVLPRRSRPLNHAANDKLAGLHVRGQQLPEFRLTPELLRPAAAAQPPRPASKRTGRAALTASHTPPPIENDMPVVRLVALLLQESVQQRASHILIQRKLKRIIVRYVIDGNVVDIDEPPVRLWEMIVARFKALAGSTATSTEGVTSGVIKISIGEAEHELAIHMAAHSILIELPSAQALPAIPGVVEQWWENINVPLR